MDNYISGARKESNDDSPAINSSTLSYSGLLPLDYSQMPDLANPLLPLSADSFYEISARLLLMAVKWIKNLPPFGNLSFRDQVILLEESWTELFLISAIQWSLPFEKCSIFSLGNIPSGNEHSLDIRLLGDTFERFRNLSVTGAEFACLKALALFKPG